MKVEDARRLFPATQNVKYFFNGGVCPIPRPVESALREFIAQNKYGFNDTNWPMWSDNIAAAYALFAFDWR